MLLRPIVCCEHGVHGVGAEAQCGMASAQKRVALGWKQKQDAASFVRCMVFQEETGWCGGNLQRVWHVLNASSLTLQQCSDMLRAGVS